MNVTRTFEVHNAMHMKRDLFQPKTQMRRDLDLSTFMAIPLKHGEAVVRSRDSCSRPGVCSVSMVHHVPIL